METLARVLRYLAQEMYDEDGVHLEWFNVLLHLNEAPKGRLRMRDLAESLVLIPSNVNCLIDRMEEVGYVARIASPEDRRGVYAAITPEVIFLTTSPTKMSARYIVYFPECRAPTKSNPVLARSQPGLSYDDPDLGLPSDTRYMNSAVFISFSIRKRT